MKGTAFFLAFLLFALNLIPCRDAVSSTIKYSSIVESGSQSDAHKDLCSPLCICNCCSTQSVPAGPVMIEIEKLEEKPLYTEHFEDQLLEISLPVWQPPQLLS